LTTNGIRYAGLRTRPTTVQNAFEICRDIQERDGSVIDGWTGAVYETAARRMKGVVKPQHRPTRRKERM
jgi:hypothetical protein